jgi:hypothetical protein
MSFSELGNNFDSRWREFEHNMREHPETFLLGSVALGFLLQTLPVRAFVLGIVRLALFLAKPALVFWFGYRIYQYVQGEKPSQGRPGGSHGLGGSPVNPPAKSSSGIITTPS